MAVRKIFFLMIFQTQMTRITQIFNIFSLNLCHPRHLRQSDSKYKFSGRPRGILLSDDSAVDVFVQHFQGLLHALVRAVHHLEVFVHVP